MASAISSLKSAKEGAWRSTSKRKVIFAHNSENLTEEEAMEIFGKILNGALALTEKCIIHRDLKPSNIMLRENKEPVIIDLGFC